MSAVELIAGRPDEDQADFGHRVAPGELDLSHNVILYLEGITVSFDGFKALNKLALTIDAGDASRVFRIGIGVTATISGLKITGGKVLNAVG